MCSGENAVTARNGLRKLARCFAWATRTNDAGHARPTVAGARPGVSGCPEHAQLLILACSMELELAAAGLCKSLAVGEDRTHYHHRPSTSLQVL